MNLFPIRVVVSEGPLQVNEIFFIESGRFSAQYFLANVALQMPALLDKDGGVSGGESLVHRIYLDVDLQLKRFSLDTANFGLSFPNRKIYTSIDFKVDGLLRIIDQVVFTLPLDRVPELYAEDLFRAHGLPEGEVLTLFVFYLRAEIYATIRRYLTEKAAAADSAANCQTTAPEVTLTGHPDRLAAGAFVYEAHGRVAAVKGPDRRAEGRGRRRPAKTTGL